MSTSVARALGVLGLLARDEGRSATLAQLARDLGAPKSSLHAVLRALASARFLEVDHGAYRLGLAAFEVGAAYLRGVTPLRAAAPELPGLAQQVGATAHFAIVDGPHAVYLAKEDPPGEAVLLASAVGARLPAHLTAIGRACLAHAAPSAVDAQDLSLLGALGGPMARRDLQVVLATVRKRGYAVDEGETAASIRCVAAPVFDAAGSCCGAIGVSYLRHGGLPAGKVAPAVRAAAARVSERLGATSAEAAG